jgi:hypothetical protein
MESSLLEEFRSELGRRCAAAGLACETWTDISPIKRNLILVKGHESFVLYVKERGGSRGFWGVTANRVRKLSASGLRWHLVLVAGTATSAHVLADHQVIERIESGRWTLGHDGDYKVNEGPLLPVEARLESFDQIFGVLL